MEKDCECCILITGDADFIPAMQVIKDAKKEAITASVITGYSRELMNGRFRYLILGKRDLLTKCLIDYKEIKETRERIKKGEVYTEKEVKIILKSDTYADEGLLSENWLSKEDNSAWKDL